MCIRDRPTIALEQVNQQTLRITMLLMFALFGVMFWAIWSDLITVFSYLDSITPVSYTHLDVYKRQGVMCALPPGNDCIGE